MWPSVIDLIFCLSFLAYKMDMIITGFISLLYTITWEYDYNIPLPVIDQENIIENPETDIGLSEAVLDEKTKHIYKRK